MQNFKIQHSKSVHSSVEAFRLYSLVMRSYNSRISTISRIIAIEDNYFDNPPINPSPPVPIRITIPIRQVEGGSPIGRIIGEIYYSAETRILQYIRDDEMPDYYPTHVEWHRATTDELPSISLQIDRRENAISPDSTLPPSPVPSSVRVEPSRLWYIVLLCLGAFFTGVVTLMVIYLEYFHDLFT